MFGTFKISVGTPFFHGTINSPRAIVSGLKPSKATPGGTDLVGMHWFFASQMPAFLYTICDESSEYPAVLEYEATKELNMLDLRKFNSGLDFSSEMSKLAFSQIASSRLDGIVLGNTTGGGDYEYGFISTDSLKFNRYHLANRNWRRIDRGLELLADLGREQYAIFEEDADAKDLSLSSRTESAIQHAQTLRDRSASTP
ncbi:hypothetical protein [Methylorubrum populi]